MSKSGIPASPTRKGYTESAEYRAQAKANAIDIFDRGDPFKLFQEWMSEAREKELNDSNAMSLATIDHSGMPDVRIVLLKTFDERGFVFFSNARSAKGEQLEFSKQAALCVHWKSLRRQVRIRGQVNLVSEKESDEYFATRAREAQIGAWTSQQSETLASREQFENEYKQIEKQYLNQPVPRPAHWQGWRVNPQQIEFWMDRPFRLHDRLVFKRASKNLPWTKGRLYP